MCGGDLARRSVPDRGLAKASVLDTLEIEATEAQRGSVIWMHGLGASNDDFESVVPELDAGYLRFIFPAAPLRPVTINGGMRMPAWYDILTFDDPPLREKADDVREAGREIERLIEREHERGIPYSSIVLAGFSQGGAMALHVGLRAREGLGGVVVLSGYLVLPEHFESERSASNQKTPFLYCHGRQDPIVPHFLGKAGFERLKAAGYPAEWAEYPMQHSLCLEEVERVRAWLRQRFPTA